ncbi:hypothetical protein D918_04647 [Trichuris suis]|nr:hypothetical protein D918_04647 [Trichuris suis]
MAVHFKAAVLCQPPLRVLNILSNDQWSVGSCLLRVLIEVQFVFSFAGQWKCLCRVTIMLPTGGNVTQTSFRAGERSILDEAANWLCPDRKEVADVRKLVSIAESSHQVSIASTTEQHLKK